jgi:hypothetical protein
MSSIVGNSESSRLAEETAKAWRLRGCSTLRGTLFRPLTSWPSIPAAGILRQGHFSLLK